MRATCNARVRVLKHDVYIIIVILLRTEMRNL